MLTLLEPVSPEPGEALSGKGGWSSWQLRASSLKLNLDELLCGTKTHLPQCLVIHSGLTLCFLLKLCNRNKSDMSSDSSTKFVI